MGTDESKKRCRMKKPGDRERNMTGWKICALTLGLASALAATSASTVGFAQSLADVALMTGSDRQAKLEAGARKEGEFMLYTAQTVDDGVRPFQEAFTKKYPYVKFNFYRAPSPALVQRILSETRANKPIADVVVGSASAALYEAKLLQSFKSPELDTYPKDYIGPDNLWGPVRFSYNGIAYNTKQVPAAEAPQTWEALLDPRWKGKMIWITDLGTGGPLLIHHLRSHWGEKKAGEYFDKLGKQALAGSAATNQTVLDLLIAGEHQILVSAALHQVIRAMNEGAPVGFTSPDPVIARPEHVMLLNSAPHPYASMLFIDFQLSVEGQKLLSDNSYLPAHPKVGPPDFMKPIVPRLAGKSEILYGPEDTTKNADVLKDIYAKITQ